MFGGISLPLYAPTSLVLEFCWPAYTNDDDDNDKHACYAVGRRCSLKMTEESNFIKIVVFGLGAPFTATKCAVTLQHV